MAIRNIRKEGDEILKKKSREVEVIDDKVRELIEDMIETMHKYDGVGLAAVQVEVDEGCLSYPNKFAKVKRPVEVTVEGLNENGEKVKIKAVDLLAQALCHEIDHLNGITFVDVMEEGTLQYVDPNQNN